MRLGRDVKMPRGGIEAEVPKLRVHSVTQKTAKNNKIWAKMPKMDERHHDVKTAESDQAELLNNTNIKDNMFSIGFGKPKRAHTL